MQQHVTDEELAIYGASSDDDITSRLARELIALRAALSPIVDHGVDIDISRLTTSGLLIALRSEEQAIAAAQNLVVRRARELRAWSLESELARRNARATRELDPQ